MFWTLIFQWYLKILRKQRIERVWWERSRWDRKAYCCGERKRANLGLVQWHVVVGHRWPEPSAIGSGGVSLENIGSAIHAYLNASSTWFFKRDATWSKWKKRNISIMKRSHNFCCCENQNEIDLNPNEWKLSTLITRKNWISFSFRKKYF